MTSKDWKQEFNDRFSSFAGIPKKDSLPLTHNNVRDFINEALSSQRKEWVDKTLAMKKECHCRVLVTACSIKHTFNATLDAVASEIGKEETI